MYLVFKVVPNGLFRYILYTCLANALKAFALFRSARCGQMGHDPRKYLDLVSDNDWLYTPQVWKKN